MAAVSALWNYFVSELGQSASQNLSKKDGVVKTSTFPPRLEAQFYKKLMLIDRFFILIELLLNNFNKIKLLGDRNFLRVNQKLSPKKSQPKEKDLHQISSFR